MKSEQKWQWALLNDLSERLWNGEDVRALILTGSLADDSVAEDEWSDLDLTIVVSDNAVARFFSSRDWLESFGQIVGLEQHDGADVKTVRVCFAPCKRVDVSLIPRSVLSRSVKQKGAAVCRAHAVIWSKIPELDSWISSLFLDPALAKVADYDIAQMADNFWFKASVAFGKTMRNDLLVALHLALDLARDCLVLQMMRRDREKGTTIHRFGGFGNDMVSRLCTGNRTYSPVEILDLVIRSGELFDELACDLSPVYTPRSSLLLPAIERAKAICGTGDSAGHGLVRVDDQVGEHLGHLAGVDEHAGQSDAGSTLSGS